MSPVKSTRLYRRKLKVLVQLSPCVSSHFQIESQSSTKLGISPADGKTAHRLAGTTVSVR